MLADNVNKMMEEIKYGIKSLFVTCLAWYALDITHVINFCYNVYSYAVWHHNWALRILHDVSYNAHVEAEFSYNTVTVVKIHTPTNKVMQIKRKNFQTNKQLQQLI